MALWWRPGAKLGRQNHTSHLMGWKRIFCMKSKLMHPMPGVQTCPSYTQEALKNNIWPGDEDVKQGGRRNKRPWVSACWVRKVATAPNQPKTQSYPALISVSLSPSLLSLATEAWGQRDGEDEHSLCWLSYQNNSFEKLQPHPGAQTCAIN